MEVSKKKKAEYEKPSLKDAYAGSCSLQYKQKMHNELLMTEMRRNNDAQRTNAGIKRKNLNRFIKN